jgi:hypothetical protein
MKSKRDALDVLFPAVRARLLRLLFTVPTTPRYVRELMNLSGLTLHTVQDELRKLSALGLVGSWSNGYNRFYEANHGHPLFDPLLRVVQRSDELPAIKRSILRGLGTRPGSRKTIRGKPTHLPPD